MLDDTLSFNNHAQPMRSDAVKNRALILETAQRLFTEQGVEAVSMSAIAEAAGIGKGTLYRHFDNKTELCQALLDHDQRDLQARVFERLRLSPVTPRETLYWFMHELIGFVDRNLPLLCAESTSHSLEFPAHWWWRQTIRGLLTQAQFVGDLDAITDSLYILTDIHAVRFQRHVRGYSVERICDGLDLLIRRVLA
jgi:AcrR family transcriptional regulator